MARNPMGRTRLKYLIRLLELEEKGVNRIHPSAYSILKKEFGSKSKSRKELLIQLKGAR